MHGMVVPRAAAWGVVLGISFFRRRLDETENVAIRVSDIELRSIRHLAQWDSEGNARSRETLGQLLCIAHDNARVQVLIALERRLVALRGRPALKMNMAPIANYAPVEVRVQELKIKSKLLTIESERPRHFFDSEHRRNVA
jgi:hypothetical protein